MNVYFLKTEKECLMAGGLQVVLGCIETGHCRNEIIDDVEMLLFL